MTVIITISLSILGIVLATSINMPLPFLLGPLIILTFSSILKAKVTSMSFLRDPVFFMLGIYLGNTLFINAGNIELSSILSSLVYMIIFNITIVYIVAWYLIKFANYSKTEAVFTALPGLLAYIMAYCISLKLPFEKIIIPHTIRVIMIVVLIPFVYNGIYSVEHTQYVASNVDWSLPTIEIAYLLDIVETICIVSLCGLPLLFIFYKLRVANIYFLAGMLASVFAYYNSLVTTVLPNSGLQIILTLIGIMIGTRLAKVRYKNLLHYSIVGIASTTILLIVTMIFAYIVSVVLKDDFFTIFLAYTPGGVHEMVLIAIIYGIEPLFITIHHLARMFIISIMLPFIHFFTK